jgi:hypothetical protein
VILQVLGDGDGVLAVAVHAHRQGLDALQDQEAVEGRDGAAHVAQRHDAGAADVGRGAQRLGVDHAVVGDVRLVEHREALGVLGPGELPESTSTPPMVVPWPPMYLVSACTTMSQPCSKGRHR